VAAAVGLLDAEGLGGLNMRALGERLGSAATAAYWHVGSKADLVVFAADQVWHEISLPDVEQIGWRRAAAVMATELHALLLRHPWLVEAFGSYVVFGPGKARHDDHSLFIFEAAGFGEDDADRAATTVFTFVLGSALGHAAATSMRRRTGGEGGARLQKKMSAAQEIALQFPRLSRRVASPAAAYAAAPEGAFELGLAAILDGLDARLAVSRKRTNR
jgi:AcrR family transcriptional regulator